MPLPAKALPSRVIITSNAFGWRTLAAIATLLFLMTTTMAMAEQEINTETIPISASVLYHQYDHGRLYQTQFEAHPCQPRKIHLSPSSDVDDQGLYNATVSFTMDLNNALDYDSIRTIVTYGVGDSQQGSVLIRYEDVDLSANQLKIIKDEYTLVRFNYTSPTTKKYYRSDLIHHITLQDLEAGKQRYWYKIRVEQEALVLPSLQPLVPPLLKPMENWYATEYPLTTRFFLRGSYQHYEQNQKLPWETQITVLGETPLFEFTTPPLYGQPTAIALVGDLGQTQNSTRTMARILGAATPGSYESSSIARILHTADSEESDDRQVTNLFIAGDLSYADGDPNRWESWLDLAEPLLRQVPMVSVPGNHEIECDFRTNDVFGPYESFFRNPNRIQEAIEIPPSQEYIDSLGWCATPSEFLGRYDYGNAYFSYKEGLVHTIFLNSYASLMDGSKQREWLMNVALPQVDRDLTPWLVVVFHTPLYTTFLNHYGELNPKLMMTSGLREVFDHYQVNLVVSGHDHAYLRTKPLGPNGKFAENGTIFWTLGAGGNREGHATYRNPLFAEGFVAKRNNDEYGFGLFFAPNATHAHLQWMRDEDNDYSNAGADDRPGNSALVMRDDVWIENRYYKTNLE